VKPSRRQVGWFFTGLGALLIASQTLVPQPPAIRALPSLRSSFAWDDLAGLDMLFNVLLFIPFGIGLRLLGISRMKSVAIAAVLSGAVELLQAGVILGRFSNARDVLMNTLGALLGVLLADGWRRLAFPSEAEARRLAVLSAACWLLLSGGEAALLGRAFLPTIWFGQWAPEGVFPATFSGRVLDVGVNSLDLRGGRLPNADRVRSALLADRWTLTVDATTGTPTPDLCSVFSIFDGEEREMLVVGQQGIDLLARYRTRAAAMGLRSPSIILPGAFALPPGEPIRISMSFDRGVISLTAAASTKTVSREVWVSPSWGWRLVMPFDIPGGPLSRVWSCLWTAALLIPIGFWMGRGIGAFKVVVLGGLLLFVGTGLTPLLFQLPPARPEEWTAATTGLAIGWWLSRARRQR
jgi:hypothetical protein